MKRLALLILYTGLSMGAYPQPSRNWSSSDILLGLHKLKNAGSVLYIAAHPDDENTRLLSYLANESGVRTGYLSITRGDGGQNLIGKEQGELLGLIRTQELLAARRVDGAEQFFTRANDFGYSKNPEETFTIWNHDSVLADMVWVIRNFKPDIIVSRFGTDGSGGHGHHTASAILASEAFDAAADPVRFPWQLTSVKPWKANRLLFNSSARFFNPKADMTGFITLDIGLYNPLLGKSYGELAAESRSMHKSQGFGSSRGRGSQVEYFKPLKGDTSIKSVLENLDFSWEKIDGGKRISVTIDTLLSAFNPHRPQESVAGLIQLYDLFDNIKDVNLKERKKNETLELILACTGFFADAVSNSYSAAPGDTSRITLSAINRSGISVSLKKIFVENLIDTITAMTLSENKLYSLEKLIRIPAGHPVSNPYWLNEHSGSGLYTVKQQSFIGMPQNEAAISAVFEIELAGHVFQIKRPVQYKWVEPSDGERYRPFLILPEMTVKFIDDVQVFSSAQPEKVAVQLKAGRDSITGLAKINLPAEWQVTPSGQTFSLNKKGEEALIYFSVTPPAVSADVYATAEASIEGKTHSKELIEIKYGHIPVQTYLKDASSRFLKFDLKRKLKTIGYVEGAGDEVASCLTQAGYSVETLDEIKLGESDLSQFDAIVVGIRAFNTNERLLVHRQRLLDYVSKGGNLVIQYNTNSFVGVLKTDIGPYPFKIGRERVTNEKSEVTFELPDHPVLNIPNKISKIDFEGWIQERGIYFSSEWSEQYQTPLSMFDPGEKPARGNTLIAQYGKGYFIYTGLAFFRQLPAGVPGAYRLFINMIEIGK